MEDLIIILICLQFSKQGFAVQPRLVFCLSLLSTGTLMDSFSLVKFPVVWACMCVPMCHAHLWRSEDKQLCGVSRLGLVYGYSRARTGGQISIIAQQALHPPGRLTGPLVGGFSV